MSLKLRDLIRRVRACKTASEERAVIAKESAMIRTAIREEQEHYRHRNVAKLLFMHMLGYPTHFGQLECMKLIASPHFPEKRIGYLGMMLLLSEQADVLMLSTNSLKNDLNSDNKFVAGLALCTIGNLATADMSRDLAPEVDKHLKSSQPYLRKKACLAMTRCLVKCPDMVEDFVERVTSLLKDRSHGVLITVVQLMTQVLMLDQQNSEEEGYEPGESPCQVAFAKLVPTLVKMLRNLLSMGHSPDHDVSGVSDPFLQVQILTLLRLLGTNDESASEQMNDVLAQVATNTETSKNAGNAILYEAVQTIMAVESDDGLRVLAINILGRFLLNRDNNIRYVALNTLSRCLQEEKAAATDDTGGDGENANTASSALQRHRTTIVDCLKDPDVSIRQRALELIYHLVNSDNVETLTAELLNYLVLCPRDHRADICSRVLRVVERFSPNDRWRVDTLITMLTIAGRESTRDVQSSTIVYISRSPDDLRAYATHRLLKAIRDDDGSQLGLLSVGIWCIGEYGDLLLAPYTYTPQPGEGTPVSITFMALEPDSIVSTVEDVTKRHSCPEHVKQTSLTCFAKLSDRFKDRGDQAVIIRLHDLVKKNQNSHSLELQLRSCEYDALLNAAKGIATPRATQGGDNDDMLLGGNDGGGSVSVAVTSAAKDALARMPVVDLKILQRKQAQESFGDIEANGDSGPSNKASAAEPFGMDDIFGGGSAATADQQNGGALDAAQPAEAGTKSDMDLLSDIFAAPGPSAATPAPVNPMDLFGGPPATNVPVAAPVAQDPFAPVTPITPAIPQQQFAAPAAQTAPVTSPPAGPVTVPCCSHGGLTVEFECTKPDTFNKQKSTLVAKFINTTKDPIVGLNLQIAVPKYCTMQLQPPTSTTVPPTVGAATVTQTVHLENTMLATKNLMLKVKLGFTLNGTKVDHLVTCNAFPAGQF